MMAETLIPFRTVPGWPPGPAPVYLLDLHDTPATACTDEDGDKHGRLCLCHWSPWVDQSGFPDPDYEPQVGDPFADIAAAEPWQPRRLAVTS